MQFSTLPAAKCRENFADVLLRVFKEGDVVIVTHHRRPFACIGPIDLLTPRLSNSAKSILDNILEKFQSGEDDKQSVILYKMSYCDSTCTVWAIDLQKPDI